MRVNISYAVDIDDLPTEAEVLFRKTLGLLEKVCVDLDTLMKRDKTDVMAMVAEIDEQRQKLALIDARLSDYAAIMAGYQEARAQLYLAEQERERQVAGEISPEAQKLIEQIEENEHDNSEGNGEVE